MLNIAALRQQQIPLAMEPRATVPFHLLIKPIGPACNLACRYCYYPQGETPVRKMDDATLESFIRRYIAAQPAGAGRLISSGKAANRCWPDCAFIRRRWRCSSAMPRGRHHQQQPANQRHAHQRCVVPPVP